MDDCNISAKYGEDLDVKIKQAEAIMAEGGFLFKEWVRSGDPGEKEIGKELSKALGVYWRTQEDKGVYKVKVIFGKKIRNRRNKPYITADTIEEDFPKKFTNHLALKLKLRLLYREIIVREKLSGNAGWDEELPDSVRDAWVKIAKEMYELVKITFNRV